MDLLDTDCREDGITLMKTLRTANGADGSPKCFAKTWIVLPGLPDYKPVSVLLVSEEWQPFLLAGDLSPAPATYPEVVTERTAPAPLFGLAPHGVCPASRIAAAAVRSYRTFSPLPGSCLPGGIVFCGTFRKARFERAPPAVSRHVALWRPDFPLAPLGFPRADQRLPVRQARIHYGGWDGRGAMRSQRIPTRAIEIVEE